MSTTPEPGRDAPAPSTRSSRRDPGRTGRFLWDMSRSVFFTLMLFLVLRALVVEAFKIPTSSMEGTLLAGDFLLVNKAVYGAEIPGLGVSFPALAEPERGEVIVFHPPHDPDKYYVKRLVGLPGDTLEMRVKRLFRNGRPVEEPYVRHIDPAGDAVHPGMAWQSRFLTDQASGRRYRPSRDTWGPLVVPPERYFVLGDNRDNSEDSRYWGFVERDEVTGRPWIVYYSSKASQTVGMPSPGEVRWDRIGGRVQ